MKILILEDLKTDAELLKRAVLKVNKGALFTLATNKEEFIERLEWGTYDVVLADYHLPDYNGLEALLFVREHYGDLPFIFVTGSLASEEKVAGAILQGANGYMLKGDRANFAERFRENMERINMDQALRAQRQEKERLRNLKLQKMQHLLMLSSDFPEKEALEELLEEIIGEHRL